MVYSSSGAEAALDAVFTALAHPARRAALREVARRGERPAMNELAASLEMSPQALNKHLASLERAGLITRERHGRSTHARANPEVLGTAKDWIVEMTDYWNAQLDSLAAYIDRLGLADDNPKD